MIKRILTSTLLLALLASIATASENWPQFRGPHADGHADSKHVATTWSETENVTWKRPIYGRGWSSPVIWKDQIWLTTATLDGKQLFAVCIDRQSGDVIHNLKLFEIEKPRFRHLLNSYASPTPVVEEGRVFISFGSYGTACLDTATGKTLWTRQDLPCNHFRGPGSSPMPYKDQIIVHYDGFDFQYVVALDKTTGKNVWKVDRDVEYGTDDGDIMKAYNTPIIINVGGREQLISPTSKATISYDPRTGKEIWRVRYSGFSSTARPLFDGRLLFINTGFSKAQLHAVRADGLGDVTDTHAEWRITQSIPSKPSHILLDGLIYMVHDGGVAMCIEADTGKTVWRKRIGGKHSASAIYAGGHIYFCDQEGTTTVIRPGRKYGQVAANKLNIGCMASPAAVGKSLFLRTETHLYRIDEAN